MAIVVSSRFFLIRDTHTLTHTYTYRDDSGRGGK